MNRPAKNKSIERLLRALDKIASLKQMERESPEFEKWKRDAVVAISRTFADKTNYVIDFNTIRYTPTTITLDVPHDYQMYYVRGLDSAASLLESMIDEIKEYWEDDDDSISLPTAEPKVPELANKVFVVHGRDDGTKQTVARFLTKLKLEPIILHEKANQGRTIIEKFEEYAQVGFAVVLLTPDDTCRAEDESGTPRFRARQNVILELGFFLGKLGRPQTFALRRDDVEIPSDYEGVIYTSMDDKGAWRMDLVRELKAAGLDVDANLAL